MSSYRSQFTREANFGLARRLMVVLSSVILLGAIAVLSISVFVQKQMIEDRLNMNAIHLASLIKEVSIPAILRNDPASLDVFFEELESRSDIVSVSIVDPEGWLWKSGGAEAAAWLAPVDDPFLREAIVAQEPRQTLGENYLHRAGPIAVAGDVIGFLNLRVARAPIEQELRGLWVSTAAISIACVIVGPLIAWVIARRLSEPLLRLQEASRRVASGDFSHRIESHSNDEFGLVAQSFNNMLDELHSSFLETKRVAYEDKLTGVPNRSWLSLQIENLTKRTDPEDQFAALFLDVDRFKEVNDTHGHHVGDMLLRAFTERLRNQMQELGLKPTGVRVHKKQGLLFEQGEALLSRLGGDEFTILVDGGKSQDLARSIVAAMEKPFALDGLNLKVSTSIGIALFPDHATSREHLLKCADVAMYQAKNDVRGTFAVYDRDKHKELLARSQMEKDIDRAVANDEFELFLQPKFDVASEELVGVEALIRWNHPERGFVRPDDFLPVTAAMGLMPRVGQIMVGKAIRVAAEINQGRGKPITMAVNIASEELLAPGFADRLKSQLEDNSLDPRLLEVEITEGTAMEQNDLVEHNIDLLRELGVKLAVDDFGVGYSNLGRLKTLAFDTLKIDRGLIMDVATDDAARGLFQTVVDMAKVLHADVVSEGVETPEQLAFLQERGVQTYQGYYGGRPMPLGEFKQLVVESDSQNRPAEVLKLVS